MRIRNTQLSTESKQLKSSKGVFVEDVVSSSREMHSPLYHNGSMALCLQKVNLSPATLPLAPPNQDFEQYNPRKSVEYLCGLAEYQSHHSNRNGRFRLRIFAELLKEQQLPMELIVQKQLGVQ